MILIFSTNTNRESVAYRSFNFTSFKLEVSEKLPQGLTLHYHQSLAAILIVAKLGSTETSVELGTVTLCCTWSQQEESALATHLDAGKSLEPRTPSEEITPLRAVL